MPLSWTTFVRKYAHSS
ncbi:hypothetical protein HU200_021965 [Digitaria exilis]|uniref:Uncharacterized protein n=1 Tax=Digitaria exilis TaxID=1010633 RepID=A0A835CAX0_9POAL|nr:hypothetical protein HU200_021965 [Digitaria exilis]